MYWTDRGTKKIRRANLDGTRSEDLVTHPAKAPTRRQVPNLHPPGVAGTAFQRLNPRPAPGGRNASPPGG